MGPTTLWVTISSSFHTPPIKIIVLLTILLAPPAPAATIFPSQPHVPLPPPALLTPAPLHPASAIFNGFRRTASRRCSTLASATAAPAGCIGLPHTSPHPHSAAQHGVPWHPAVPWASTPTPPPRTPPHTRSVAPRPSSTSHLPSNPPRRRWPRSVAGEGVFVEDEELGCASCSCLASRTPSSPQCTSDTPDRMLGLHTTVARGHIMVPLLPHRRGRRRRQQPPRPRIGGADARWQRRRVLA
jgi:hypothetical protein